MSKTYLVADIHADQIQVDGQWFHAERVFGRAASDFKVGHPVEELMPKAVVKQAVSNDPDELVGCDLYRGCSSNEMNHTRSSAFVEVMFSYGGWGEFPMIAGYIETIDASDVAQCEDLVANDLASVWLDEMGWSRLVTRHDIGQRYVHIDNGHHRMAAAAIASRQLGPIQVPVFDLRREESQSRYISLERPAG